STLTCSGPPFSSTANSIEVAWPLMNASYAGFAVFVNSIPHIVTHGGAVPSPVKTCERVGAVPEGVSVGQKNEQRRPIESSNPGNGTGPVVAHDCPAL